MDIAANIWTGLHRTRDNNDIRDNIASIRLNRLASALKAIAGDYSQTFQDRPGDEAYGNVLRDAGLMLSSQYNELSHMIAFMAQNQEAELGPEVNKKRLIVKLGRLGLNIRQLNICPRELGGPSVHLICSARRQEGVVAGEIGWTVSEYFDEDYVIKEGRKLVKKGAYTYFVLVPRERYRLKTAAAAAGYIKGQPPGDRYMTLDAGSGESAMLLGDGCGQGREAGQVSSQVIKLASRFLKCGYRGESVISLINSLMLISSDESRYSTLDMCLVNRYTGEATWAKSGASLSFIKHEDWVETVTGSGLPIGLINNQLSETTKKKLYHGDMIIMISDGILDGMGRARGEERLRRIIKSMSVKEPKDVAGEILMAALRDNNYQPADDCLVLVGTLERITPIRERD